MLLDAAAGRQPVPAATLLAPYANDTHHVDNACDADDAHHADEAHHVDDADQVDRAGAIAVLERCGLLTRSHTADGLSFVVDSDTIEVLASDPRRSRA